ncbi:MAG: Fe-S cluster assembly ATPase SufC [bacterium]|nr:Fe-S cluster assembly ATPase SufC [bacterium]
MKNNILEIKELKVSIEDKEVLHGINLSVPVSEVHVVMGPNGSGKTTLAQSLMGHPKYIVNSGEAFFHGQDILKLTADKRSQLGIFLAFQYPKEVPGVKLLSYLRTIYNSKQKAQDPKFKRLTMFKFKEMLNEKMDLLNIDSAFIERYLNSGFSGGEKKKSEMLQMLLLEPEIAILDETDSGLDVDALKTVCKTINDVKKKTGMGVLLITHYNKILDYLNMDYAHVMIDGKIVQSGGKEFAAKVEDQGYDWLRS